MKNINEIAFVCQARLQSQRVPRKMIKPFAGTTLMDILIDKVKQSKVIPTENFFLSIHDQELIDLATRKEVQYFHRSEASALAENSIQLIYEWHDKLPFKYVVLISACNPLLTVETIENFVKAYLESDKGGMFGVIGKKQYFWDNNGNMISPWPKEQKIMNTKTMGITYEAAHCLYASEMDIIGDGYWMDRNTPPQPELFVLENELEAFDIDYSWQFETGEILYNKFKNEF